MEPRQNKREKGFDSTKAGLTFEAHGRQLGLWFFMVML